ncbi:MAG: allantoinase AllB [Aeoliella sp.]
MSAAAPRLALVSSRVVTPAGVGPRAVIVSGECIEAVVSPHEVPRGIEAIDCGGLVVMPGVIDAHVHINEPGRTEWEGFESATRAAAAGGVTTLVDMPLNSTPVTTTTAALEQKRSAAERKLWVDVGFYGGLVPGNVEHLEPLIDSGVCGIKAFLCDSGLDDFPPVDEPILRLAMPILARRNVALLVHAELVDHTLPRLHESISYCEYLASRPEKWETSAIELLIRLCEEYRCPVHVVHLANGNALSLLVAAKQNGLPLTVETCPHYLYFQAESIPDADPRYKCAPPIRELRHCELLWRGVVEGKIDLVATDHSPCPPEMKHLAEGNFAAAWGGIASVGLTIPVIWTRGREQGLNLVRLSQLLSTAPAQLAGVADCKGAISPGMDADLVVWDPDAEWTVNAAQLFHRHKTTPYDGEQLVGRVEKTYLRGNLVFDADKLVDTPVGRELRRDLSRTNC